MELGQQFGEYALQRRLGTGGQGEVFEVRDAIGMAWALKIGHPIRTNDQSALARFVREAQWVNTTLGALPRNCGILVGEHYGVHDHRLYVKMRLVQGESLAQRLKGDPLSVAEAVGLAQRIAEIVAVAHQHNAIHRDLKPENVLLETGGSVEVVDWGCIHLVEAGHMAQSGTGPLCTLGYAPPEQYELKTPAASATDVYALGVMLFEMITGHNPFLDSWRDVRRAPEETRVGAGITRTAQPGDPDHQGATVQYPTARVRNVREAAPDAVTRSTAETNVLPLEERLVDFAEPPRSSFTLNSTAARRPTSIAEVLSKQVTFDLERFRSLTAPLPRELVRLLDEMLRPQANERPASMSDVANRLSSIAAELGKAPAAVRRLPRKRGARSYVRFAAAAGAIVIVWWLVRSEQRGEQHREAPRGANSSSGSQALLTATRAGPPKTHETPTPLAVTSALRVSAITFEASTTADASPSRAEKTGRAPLEEGVRTPQTRKKAGSQPANGARSGASANSAAPLADLPYFGSKRHDSK